MGVIKRQTITGTIFIYAGVVIGFITSALIFPRYLTTEQIGLIGIFLSYSFILAQLATLGTGRITIVMFPYFKDRARHHHGFFFLMLMVSLAGLVIAFGGFFLYKQWLLRTSSAASNLFLEHINYIYPLTFFTLLFFVFDSFNTTLFHAVRGIFLKEFIQRILILAFILLYVFKLITFDEYLPLFVVALALPGLIMVVSLTRHPEFSLKPQKSPLTAQHRGLMSSLGLFGILIGFSGMVITNIDRIMVERLMGLGATGVYTTMAYFATLVVLPSRALLKIADPVIAKSWKDKDLENVRKNYYESSLSQFLIGSLILVGLWVNIDNILIILPGEFAEGKYVILLIGLAFLADMMSGTATYILANSAYYKYQTYFIMALVLLIIATNYLLIPIWGLTGAAVSTLFSKLVINVIRHQLIYRKFGLQPYNRVFLYITSVALVSYLAGYLVPEIKGLIPDLVVRSFITGGLFLGLVLAFRIYPELNERLARHKSTNE